MTPRATHGNTFGTGTSNPTPLGPDTTDPAAVLAAHRELRRSIAGGGKERVFFGGKPYRDALCELWDALSQQTARLYALRKYAVPSMTDYAIDELVAALASKETPPTPDTLTPEAALAAKEKP